MNQKDREAMQMALDAFEAMISEGWSYCGPERTSKAQTASYEATLALRERLAQPEPKPYNPMENNADYERGFIDGAQDQMRSSVDKAVNRMARREWVSLTDEEIKEIVGPWGETPVKGYTRKLFDAIETKLKEKNCG
jgi:hypothetical protein